LDDKNTTVSKAVYAVGYVNVSHFSQAFRKFYGRRLMGNIDEIDMSFFIQLFRNIIDNSDRRHIAAAFFCTITIGTAVFICIILSVGFGAKDEYHSII